MEWKSTASGDYVIGLEPANSSVYGRLIMRKEGTFINWHLLQKKRNVLNFTLLDGEEEIRGSNPGVSENTAEIE